MISPPATLEGSAARGAGDAGEMPDAVEVQENGCIYLADLLHGQKTGWFYDQRENRLMVAKAAADPQRCWTLYRNAGGLRGSWQRGAGASGDDGGQFRAGAGAGEGGGGDQRGGRVVHARRRGDARDVRWPIWPRRGRRATAW